MKKEKMFEAVAVFGLLAVTMAPFAASHAHDGDHEFSEKWSKDLEQDIKAKVRDGLKKGAVGMEKGARKMMLKADELDAYADRIESDPQFRESEVARQSNNHNRYGPKLTSQELLEKAPEFRLAADEMREGAEKMRESAEKMRRGET